MLVKDGDESHGTIVNHQTNKRSQIHLVKLTLPLKMDGPQNQHRSKIIHLQKNKQIHVLLGPKRTLFSRVKGWEFTNFFFGREFSRQFGQHVSDLRFAWPRLAESHG